MNRWILAAAGALGLAFASLPFTRGLAEHSAAETPAVCDAKAVKKAPDFTLKDLDGRDVRLADYKGKVVLVNFWATWCGPCKYEIPMFVDFQNRYGNRGLTFLGISVDDERETLQPFVAEYKMNYPVLIGLGREDVQDDYGPMMGIPVTILVGRDGNVCKRFFGLHSKDKFEQDIKAVL
jgi:peroxiredoxin